MQRRNAERIYPDARLASWKLDPDDVLRPATVIDRSRSGIGLLVAGQIDAHHGDPILIQESGRPRRARIIRMSSHRGTDETTLGCRWISEHQAHDRSRSRRVTRRRVIPGGAA
ncbi:MAG: hypothetical protein KDA28_15170 [Phycisphaerales bacterium]|nr:hypothetical protein [Phycisphaerales bacterium]